MSISSRNIPFTWSSCRKITGMLLFLLLTFSPGLQAQVLKAYSFNSAYAVLNTSSSASTSNTHTYTGNIYQESPINAAIFQKYTFDKKWRIRFGIPVQISLDYAWLRARMISAYEANPGLYANGSPQFQEAVDILGWTDFATISSWQPVRCRLHFYFTPPALADYSPLGLIPLSTPVKGTSEFWIR